MKKILMVIFMIFTLLACGNTKAKQLENLRGYDVPPMTTFNLFINNEKSFEFNVATLLAITDKDYRENTLDKSKYLDFNTSVKLIKQYEKNLKWELNDNDTVTISNKLYSVTFYLEKTEDGKNYYPNTKINPVIINLKNKDRLTINDLLDSTLK